MRTIVILLAATLLAAAAAPAAAAEAKIAVISLAQLLRDAPQVKSADARFKGEFQKREDDLKAEGKKLDDDIGRFRREADAMSPQQRTSAQNDLNTRKTNFELKQRQFGEQAQQRNGELQREVLDQVNRAIVEVAREKGIDIVVRDPAYASEAFDVTGDVLKKLAEYAAATPAAEPKKKPKK
jgi:outer membrane protein